MAEVGTRPGRFRNFRDPIFLLVNFGVWLIYQNTVSVFLFGVYGLFYLVAVLLKERKYDGAIGVSKTDSKMIFGLDLGIPPEELAIREEVIFEVIHREIEDPQT